MASLDLYNLLFILACLALVVLSSAVHEFAHALAAHLMGDDTARERGRLTLNPLAHLDPFGSVLLPLACFLLGGFFVAYARPVPYDPSRLRDRRVGEAVIAAAGPAANLAQALVGALLARALLPLLPDDPTGWAVVCYQILYVYVRINAMLLFFNLIPVPPLDGSKVVALFLSDSARRSYFSVERYSGFVLLAAVWLAPRLLGFDLLGRYFSLTVSPLVGLLFGF